MTEREKTSGLPCKVQERFKAFDRRPGCRAEFAVAVTSLSEKLTEPEPLERSQAAWSGQEACV